ncbi:MAG: aldolase [Patescibacteria group bacterium]|nr:aldolase [Patescibacteria group bacterium]
MTTDTRIFVPAEVPLQNEDVYLHNYRTITAGTGNLLLFAGDQKVEHLNDDFYGEGIDPANANPRHLFEIASKAKIGAFATQFGLISRYGKDYPTIPYVVKMNSKTHLIPTTQAESISRSWTNFTMIDNLMQASRLNIVGVGYTVYVGSEHESIMYEEASRIAYEAHRRGMVAIFWMYPRGKAVPHEKDPHIIAGAAGVGACLGADFVKVNYPEVPDGGNRAEALREAVEAAGRTRLICAGGAHTSAREYLQMLHDQMHIAKAHGTAAGRNIHQRSLDEAVRFCNALYAIIIEGKSVDEAVQVFEAGQRG